MTTKQIDALKAAQELFNYVIPKLDIGGSCLDAKAIQLLNRVPGMVSAALDDDDAISLMVPRTREFTKGTTVTSTSFINHAALVRAFTAWEEGFRVNPGDFRSAEEVRRMNAGTVAEESARHFAALLAATPEVKKS